MAKYTTDIFIEKAREIHADKYDYSKVNYVNNSMKVTIICPEHGEFEQTPANHLCGKGCLLCGRKQTINKRSSNTENFIIKAKEIHGDKYDYSKVNYVNNSTKVTIICPEHGEFEQTPASHLRGSGCPKCAIIQNADRCRMTTEEFINKAKEI
ncbi:MAG: hypothetical protein VZR53_16420, partial [Prevotella sp.]|nr:hypothetical protein [Prevotella sp.]